MQIRPGKTKDYVSFGDVARTRCHEQCQYISRYVGNRFPTYPNLGAGLRILGDPSNYHFLEIHQDDVEEFVKRVNDYRRSKGMIE